MRAKTRSAADRPSWNWLQNEAMLVTGNQKKPTVCMNRIPFGRGDGAARRQPRQKDDGRAQPRRQPHQRKNARQRQAARQPTR